MDKWNLCTVIFVSYRDRYGSEPQILRNASRKFHLYTIRHNKMRFDHSAVPYRSRAIESPFIQMPFRDIYQPHPSGNEPKRIDAVVESRKT